MRLLYDLLFSLFALFYLPAFILKGKHKSGWSERFGRVPEAVQRDLQGRRVLWIHGVSVGEVVQAFRLLESLRRVLPERRFVVTTTTAAGRDVARNLARPEDTLLYFPIDSRPCVRSFLDGVRPEAMIALETEIWPNLIWELSERNIPMFIVNGRISDRAIGAYRRVRRFLAPVLGRIRLIAVQDALMRDRFIELGASPMRVAVTGNMKFDWTPHGADAAWLEKTRSALQKDGSFLLIAGSTHEGEEAALLDLYRSVRRKHPGFRLLLAPRHLERMPLIQKEAEQKKTVLVPVSRAAESNGSSAGEGVFILDRMGVLGQLYRFADAVFVGGSLARAGGHNPVEPAFFEKPVLFGPHMHNFSQMANDFTNAEAALQVRSAAELKTAVARLVRDPGRCRELGQSAKRLVSMHQGATERNVDLLLNALNSRGNSQ